MSKEGMIRFKKVTKRFGEITALNRVSFEIEKGEFVFLIGPSGAGKTTIGRLLLRDYSPTSGTIEVKKKNLAKMAKKEIPALRRQMGMVFQDLKLLADLTVFENIALRLRVLGQTEEEIGKEVKSILRLVGLKNRADFFPSQLAGGELQRTAIARAVAGRPDFIFADEPTGNLDLKTAWQIVRLLKEINEQGKTVMMATHNFKIVNELKERVIEMKRGKIISDQKKGKYQV